MRTHTHERTHACEHTVCVHRLRLNVYLRTHDIPDAYTEHKWIHVLVGARLSVYMHMYVCTYIYKSLYMYMYLYLSLSLSLAVSVSVSFLA